MKKSTGIVRRLDELGRIVLPIELRKKLGLEEKDALEIYVEGSSIVLKKYENKICTKCKQIIGEKDKYCRYCGEEINNGKYDKERTSR